MKRTATFHSKISFAREDAKFAPFISKAAQEDSLRDLRNLLPSKSDAESTPDLIAWAGPAAVLGLANRNNYAMTSEVGVAISKTYLSKPVNWAHNREINIGFVNNVGFSTFGENKLISAEEAALLPICNMVLSGVLWKVASDGLAEEVSLFDDPESPWFHEMSLSWEVGFTEFSLLVGSKNVSTSRIVSDEEGIKKYLPYLREEGGEGFDEEGNEISILITDKDAICLAVGLTTRPAAFLNGVVTGSKPEKESKASQEQVINKELSSEISDFVKEEFKKVFAEMKINEKKVQIDEDLFSQVQKSAVNNNNFMKKLYSREEICDYLTKAGVDSAPLVFEEFLTSEANKGAKEYQNRLDSAASDLANSKKEAEETKTKLTAAETELAALKDKIAELESKVEEDRKQTVLASRMEELSDKFDLSEASVRKAIVKQIKDLDDTAFASWLKEDEIGGILLAGHPKKEAKASVDPDEATKALKETKASVTVPNAQDETKGIDKDKISNALIN